MFLCALLIALGVALQQNIGGAEGDLDKVGPLSHLSLHKLL